MRLRIAVVAALVCVLAVFALELSGSARRLSGTNHIDVLGFVATVPANGTVCQPGLSLPGDTGSVKLLIGTDGRPLPAISAEFLGPGDAKVTSGTLPAGGKHGYVEVPLRYPHAAAVGTLCLRIHGSHGVTIGGEPLAAGAGSASVNGKPQPAGLALYYLRHGRESWWELLPTLVQRFGFGKASFFGDWTLPAMALLLLATWFVTVKLLWKEMS